MSKITKYPFSQLYDMASGISSTKEQAGHGSPFVSFSTVFNNYFLPDTLPDLMDTSAQEQETYSIKEGDILITRTSETIDELAMSCVATKDYPCATYSGFTKRLRPKTEGIAYHKYLAFYLRSKLFRKTVTNNAFMTLRASFNEDIFSFLNLHLPEYKEQVKIGDMLYAMEQKVQLNKRICSELEAMAKTLYDYWFTQFDFPNADGKPYRSSGGEMVWNDQLKREIPKGWEAENIQKTCGIMDCLHSQKPEQLFVAENYYLLQLENLIDLGLIDLQSKYYVSKDMYDLWISRIQVEDGDLVVTNAGRIGAVSRIPRHVIAGIGRNMTAIRPNAIPAFFLYYFFKSPDFAVQMRANTDSGAFFGSLNVRGIKQLLLTVPPADSDILKKFDSMVEPMRRKIECLQLENEELIKLRDWLLPMLMNGQATVEPEKTAPRLQALPAKAPAYDARFERWRQTQGVAARGAMDEQTLRDIFDAMDEDDK